MDCYEFSIKNQRPTFITGVTIVIRKAFLSVTLLAATVAANANTILTENFDDISTLTGAGWSLVNNSTPGGFTGWEQGNGIFDAQNGANTSYIAASFLNAGEGGNISNWLISPTLTLFNGETLTFFTKSEGYTNDSLEVRLSTNGASSDVGGTDSSVGGFTTLLASINPLLDSSYPTDWTAFSVTFSGVVDGTQGRFAFRYAVPDTVTNGDYIGIDSVSVSVPEPSTIGILALGLVVMGFSIYRRDKRAAATI
jgi:hypothetical protein